MEGVKTQLQDLVNTCESLALRSQRIGVPVRLGMDMILTGNTGTGKTKLASVLQKLLFAIGVVKQPVMTVIDAVDYETFSKEWEKNTANLKGGILCIENVQKLVPTGAASEINRLDKLLSSMDKWNNDPIVILSGLSAGFKEFLVANPDVSNRFEYRFDLKDCTVSDLKEICIRELKKVYGITLNAEADAKLERIFKYDMRQKADDFGNGHLAVKKAADIFANTIRRDPNATVAIPADIPGQEFHQKSYEQIMTELDEFVGIDEIKATVQKIVNKIDFERDRKGVGAKREIKDHFLFLGNPGTGKTTLARIFADILNSLEVLPIGQLVEVSRKELVAGYVGQTALAVEKYVDMAMGGVLFIDEAYTLKSGENDGFGQEAIDTLLKLVEDRRGLFVAIAAGYSKEMGEFLSANSGMTSRFNETVNFRDYTADELTEIFRRQVKKEQLTLDADAEAFISNYFKKMYLTRTRTFGNAREVRNTLDRAIKQQGVRLLALKSTAAYDPAMANILTRADIEGEENRNVKTLPEILAELDDFIGMNNVKAEIRALANKIAMDKEMMDMGIADAEITPVHIVLTGNPGTGKTTLAKKLGEIFKAIGLLPTDKVVEKERKNLVSPYQNETAKLMDKACDEAMGGILFIDEAYALVPVGAGGGTGQGGQAGVEAVESLMTRMVRDAGKFVVICAGYQADMEEFINNANPGFRRRFTTFLHIEDYTADQLIAIYRSLAHKKENVLTPEAEEMLTKLVDEMVTSKDENFGNAGEMVKLFDKTKLRRSNRLTELRSAGYPVTREMFLTIQATDIPYDPPQMIDEEACMAELNQLIGLAAVKREVKEIADYIKVERAKAEATGKKFQGVADHYLFVGNPGTGKTTVARIMGNIFYALGVLPSNRLLEVTRKDLVEGYVGQTAGKTARMVKRAVGGVLFIDEAYSLMGDAFGQEATNTLLPMLLDYKGKMVCIAAGYPQEIKEWINSNSGLESRFTKVIPFEDYNPDELAQIFLAKAKKEMLTLTADAEQVMRVYFIDLYKRRDRNFANAREVHNYFDRVLKNQSSRLRREMETPHFDPAGYDTLLPEDML
jgi:SpoVK/Ycf46/Vps4 family AAA+-type ATPase